MKGNVVISFYENVLGYDKCSKFTYHSKNACTPDTWAHIKTGNVLINKGKSMRNKKAKTVIDKQTYYDTTPQTGARVLGDCTRKAYQELKKC